MTDGDLFNPAAEPAPVAATVVGDGKDPDALRTIGEVAKVLGIRQHVLRYWEEQFPMLKPLKRSGGRRYYRPEDVAMIEAIDRLVHREGYTLKGAKQTLQRVRPAKTSVAPVVIEAPAASSPAPALAAGGPGFAQRARLIAIRNTLVSALHES